MASRLFDLPISAISLTDKDRQWFKSRVSVDEHQLPRYKAPCAQVTSTRDVVVLLDILKEEFYRFLQAQGQGPCRVLSGQ